MIERTFFAQWILPIVNPPIRDGFITIDEGKIVAVGKQESFRGDRRVVEELGNAILLPALVNALFHPDYPMTDPQNTPRGNFFSWLNSGDHHMRATSRLDTESGLLSAIKRCYDYGTGAIGIRTRHPEISQHIEHSGMYSLVFEMLSGFRAGDSYDIWKKRSRYKDTDLTRFEHAGEFLFNLSPDVFRQIARSSRRTALPISFIRDEDTFFMKGQGQIYQYLLSRDDMDYRWQPPKTSSIRYMLNNAFCSPNTILSQLIQVDEEDLDLLLASEEVFHMCLHPRFDRQWELGTAPGQMIRDKGFNICLGTFADHMDIRAEMRSASAEYGFKPEEIIRMATLNGAKALDLDKQIGSLEPGKDAKVFAIHAKESIADPYKIILFTNERLHPVS